MGEEVLLRSVGMRWGMGLAPRPSARGAQREDKRGFGLDKGGRVLGK